MTEFRIETDSPLSDLRPGRTFDDRAEAWLLAAHKLVADAVAQDRLLNGSGEEVAPLLTNRQADHLAMGLSLLAAHFRRASA